MPNSVQHNRPRRPVICPKCKSGQPFTHTCIACGFDIKGYVLRVRGRAPAQSLQAAPRTPATPHPKKPVKRRDVLCPECKSRQPFTYTCVSCGFDIKGHILEAKFGRRRSSGKASQPSTPIPAELSPSLSLDTVAASAVEVEITANAPGSTEAMEFYEDIEREIMSLFEPESIAPDEEPELDVPRAEKPIVQEMVPMEAALSEIPATKPEELTTIQNESLGSDALLAQVVDEMLKEQADDTLSAEIETVETEPAITAEDTELKPKPVHDEAPMIGDEPVSEQLLAQVLEESFEQEATSTVIEENPERIVEQKEAAASVYKEQAPEGLLPEPVAQTMETPQAEFEPVLASPEAEPVLSEPTEVFNSASDAREDPPVIEQDVQETIDASMSRDMDSEKVLDKIEEQIIGEQEPTIPVLNESGEEAITLSSDMGADAIEPTVLHEEEQALYAALYSSDDEGNEAPGTVTLEPSYAAPWSEPVPTSLDAPEPALHREETREPLHTVAHEEISADIHPPAWRQLFLRTWNVITSTGSAAKIKAQRAVQPLIAAIFSLSEKALSATRRALAVVVAYLKAPPPPLYPDHQKVKPQELLSVMELARSAWTSYRRRAPLLTAIWLAASTGAILPIIAALGLAHVLTAHRAVLQFPVTAVFLSIGGAMALFALSWGLGALIAAVVDPGADLRTALYRGKRLWWATAMVLWMSVGMAVGGGALFIVPGVMVLVGASIALYIIFIERESGLMAFMKSFEYIRGMMLNSVLKLLPIALAGVALVALSQFSPKAVPVLFCMALLAVPYLALYMHRMFENLRSVKGRIVIFHVSSRLRLRWMAAAVAGSAVPAAVALVLWRLGQAEKALHLLASLI